MSWFYSVVFLIGILVGVPVTGFASGQVQLLGSVESSCLEEPYCFVLRVEADYVAIAGNRITVRFKQVTAIFDPENYQLTLQQSNIIPGSHSRLLLAHEPGAAENNYRAEYIWIGD